MKTFFITVCVCLFASCVRQGQVKEKPEDLVFHVSGSAEAMPSFQQGLLLLHNFEYPDAAEAFVEAQKIDPGFAMAYWGEAMSYNHPVWRLQEIEKARAALEKLGASEEERQAKAATPLEKDLIAGVDILFGEGSKTDRDKAYADFMESLYKKYPGDHEVAAFYALSLLGIKEGWNRELNTRGAAIAEAILKENPKHPGALHYLIHSDDHPEYATYALAAANDYSVVASYAGHALHMPSHIYLALGMWDEVVSSNVVSFQASIDRKNRKGLKNDALNYHGYLWLAYAYLQQGRYDSARSVFENQTRFTVELPSSRARAHFIAMRGHYLIETGAWTSGVKDKSVEMKDLGLIIQSAAYFTDGMTAFHNRKEDALMSTIAALEKEIEDASKLQKTDDGITICSAYSNNVPTQHDIDVAMVVKLELQGLSAWLRNDLAQAEKRFHEASVLEDRIGYFFGPPDIQKPSRELFGEFLLAQNRPSEALAEFETALQRSPGRTLSLKGSLQAAGKLHDEKKVDKIKKILDKSLKEANEDIRKRIISI